MNVFELTEELRKCPDGAEVKIEVWDDGAEMGGVSEYDVDTVEQTTDRQKVIVTIKD